MKIRKKIAILGGSAFSTPTFFNCIAGKNVGFPLEISLHGRDQKRLKTIQQISQLIVNKHSQADIDISASQDITECVEGADLILNQIRIGGMEGRLFDETFPRKLGIPGEETVGPGGFSNALRTIPVILNICKTIEMHAPDALMLNLSNPSSIVQYAIMKYTNIAVLGTCNTPIDTIKKVIDILGGAANAYEADWFGMHHFGWLTDIKRNGKSELGKVINNIEKAANLRVDPEIIRAINAIPAPYFYYYFHPDRYLAATEGRTLRAEQLIAVYEQFENQLSKWQEGDDYSFLEKRSASWYETIIVPVMQSVLTGSNSDFILSVKNNGTIPWLSEDAIIETKTTLEKGKISRVITPDNIPVDLKSLVSQNCTYEMLAAEAIVEHNRDKAIRALQSNLLVSNFNQVKAILEAVWPEEKKFTVNVEIGAEENRSNFEKEMGFDIPTLYYGDSAIEEIDIQEESFGVISMEVPWQLVKPRMPDEPSFVAYIDELDWYSLEALERSLPDVHAIIGVGGGMATDAAKYFAWKRNVPVDVVPTITSVDASVTKSIAARAGGHVTYIGYVVPRNVYIDYTVIGNAPRRLNRSGVGDILCGHTALFDWKLAHDAIGENYDIKIVKKMCEWLDRVEKNADAIKQMNSKGIKLIMQAFAEISIICRSFGSSRPQEGADHTFAYNAEFLTGKNFMHGELVALGTYVISSLQDNHPDHLRDIFEKCGILWQPKDLGMTKNECVQTLKTLNWYQKNFGRRYSILDVKTIEDKFIEEVVEKLDF